jgi:hypothetical protein
MTHVDVLAKFLEIFPMYQSTIRAFGPAGFNAIAVELEGGRRFIFTYKSDNDWTFRR